MDNHWIELAIAVIALAVEDYSDIEVYGRLRGSYTNKVDYIAEIEEFFDNGFCSLLVDRDFVMRAVYDKIALKEKGKIKGRCVIKNIL